jgi:hypothetical protein
MNTKYRYLNTDGRPENLGEYITWLQRKWLEIPEAYRATASVNIFEDGGASVYEITYRSPFTKEEIAIEENWQKTRDRNMFEDAKRNMTYLQQKYPEFKTL